jgi:hypothetical protein
MDLVIFAVAFIVVIIAVCVLAIWAVVREERWTQAAWPVRRSLPATQVREEVATAGTTPVIAVESVPMAHTASAAFVPTP